MIRSTVAAWGWFSLLAMTFSLSAATTRPNIIVILSDDVGFSDIGCYGGEIATPNLDALAAGGRRFSQFYNGARCCPTRASLLTGLHPHQAGVGHMMGDRGHDGYRGRLNRHCVTIAEALLPAGYRSYALGKWHVTPGQTAQALADTTNWPLQRGFARFYGTIHGAGSYFDPSSLVRDNTLITVANDRNYQPATYYYTDAIADHAVKFLRDHTRDYRAQPFFLYTAFTAAHWPLHAKEPDRAKYQGRYDAGYEPIRSARLAKLKQLGLIDDRWTPTPPAESWTSLTNKPFESRCMEVYAAQLDAMDQAIGRMIAELKTLGVFDNTVIFYLQDNGGCAEGMGRGGKATERATAPTLPPMGRDQAQFDSVPRQTRDGWPVRQGLGVMPGGPDTYVAYGRGWANVSNTPFREYKHWTHEGGISTPLIVHWPAGTPRATNTAKQAERGFGQLIREPAQLVDIMATCLDVAGATYPTEAHGEKIAPIEGRSLVPLLKGSPRLTPSRLLFWEHEGNRAVRDGSWKLVAKENQPWELYDLERDRTETRNLASSEPARVKSLAAAWDAWAVRAQVLPLGGWRPKNSATNLSSENRFTLKAGEHLDRAHAPAIVGRGFEIRATFIADRNARGVIVAQGGNVQGYALYLAGDELRFAVRTRGGLSTASVRFVLADVGTHTAVARFGLDGAMSLQVDNGSTATADHRGSIPAMPGDGLDVGADDGGAVGPYLAPNRFTGTVQSVIIELESPAE